MDTGGRGHFNPQGPRRPRQRDGKTSTNLKHFNPQGPRRPRRVQITGERFFRHFNPQGPRRPRRSTGVGIAEIAVFQSPGPSQAPTAQQSRYRFGQNISIPRALAGPDSNLPQFFSSHPLFFQQNVNFLSAILLFSPFFLNKIPIFLQIPGANAPGIL